MKMPWPTLGKNDSSLEQATEERASDDSIDRENALILHFNGKQYDLDSVPKEVQELIPRLEIADKQLQLYQDSMELISLARDTLISKINKKLLDIPSLND